MMYYKGGNFAMNSIIYILIALIICLVLFFLSKMKSLNKGFSSIIDTIGALKFRVFEHEAQLLGQKGVYVPEDTAKYIFNIIWNMIGDKERSNIENEYNKMCPEHIPLWKYVLYNYQINTNMFHREPFTRIDSVQDILLSKVDKLEEALKDTVKCSQDSKDMLNIIDKKLKNVEQESKLTEEKINNLDTKD